MPELKQPVAAEVNSDLCIGDDGLLQNDYGIFHPTAQLIGISDLEPGGTFKGIGFELELTQQTARNYINQTNRMRPVDRIKIDAEIMRNKVFAESVFLMCKGQ